MKPFQKIGVLIICYLIGAWFIDQLDPRAWSDTAKVVFMIIAAAIFLQDEKDEEEKRAK